MKITFLGTGTSHGVPMIGCDCEVCSSNIAENKRLRSSVLVEDEGGSLLIDPSIDFRQQALKFNIRNIENVLITHLHADHIFGLDELRVFNLKMDGPINLYLSKENDKNIRKIFPYLYGELIQRGGGIASVKNNIVNPFESFLSGNSNVIPLKIHHGKLPILGYRIGKFAYITDASFIDSETYDYLNDLDVLVLNCLRYRKHSTHFNVDEAVKEASRISAKKTYFTHIAHDLDHFKFKSELPSGIEPAYDGFVVEIAR